MASATRKWRLGITDAGRVVLRGTGYVLLAALIIPALGVLAILASIMLTALAVGYVLRPRVEVRGFLPDRIVAGQTASVTYVVRNIGHLMCYGLSVRFASLPRSIRQTSGSPPVSRLAPGETADVVLSIEATRRGIYRIRRPLCESGFPFNLFTFGTTGDEQETLLVVPAFSRLRMSLGHASRHVQSISPRQAGRMGVSPEYVGSRPFLRGDPPRRIDVRAWARLSVPATKEYDDTLDSLAAIVLDTRVLDRRPGAGSKEIPELEAAISLCASVAYTIDGECLIDTLLAGADLHSFATWPKAARLDRVHEVLAGLEPSKGYDITRIGPPLEQRFPEVSEVVFILLRWDGTYEPLVELAERAGCRCTVLVVGGPDGRARSQRDTGWAGDIRFVPVEAVLKGQVESL